jgi:hypothetical protein
MEGYRKAETENQAEIITHNEAPVLGNGSLASMGTPQEYFLRGTWGAKAK